MILKFISRELKLTAVQGCTLVKNSRLCFSKKCLQTQGFCSSAFSTVKSSGEQSSI